MTDITQVLKSEIKSTGSNMTLIIEETTPFLLKSMYGDIKFHASHIYAVKNSLLVGKAELGNGNSGMTIWGSESDEENGMKSGESLELYVSNSKGIYKVNGTFQDLGSERSKPGATYSNDDIKLLRNATVIYLESFLLDYADLNTNTDKPCVQKSEKCTMTQDISDLVFGGKDGKSSFELFLDTSNKIVYTGPEVSGDKVEEVLKNTFGLNGDISIRKLFPILQYWHSNSNKEILGQKMIEELKWGDTLIINTDDANLAGSGKKFYWNGLSKCNPEYSLENGTCVLKCSGSGEVWDSEDSSCITLPTATYLANPGCKDDDVLMYAALSKYGVLLTCKDEFAGFSSSNEVSLDEWCNFRVIPNEDTGVNDPLESVCPKTCKKCDTDVTNVL